MFFNQLYLSYKGIDYSIKPKSKLNFYINPENKVSEEIKEIVITNDQLLIGIENNLKEIQGKFVYGEDKELNLFFIFEIRNIENKIMYLYLREIEKDKWTRQSERIHIQKNVIISFEKTFQDEDNKLVVELVDISDKGCGFYMPTMMYSQIEKIKTIKIDKEEKDIIVRNKTFEKDKLLIGAEFKAKEQK